MIVTYGDSGEKSRRTQMVQMLRDCPVPEGELLSNLGLFLTPQCLSRILFMDFLYRQIVDIQGVVVEFGCRWGQNLSLFMALRGIYEPFNRLRRVVGFDTFEGFPAVSKQDGDILAPGMYSVTPGYENYLEELLKLQEQESPLAHIRRYEIIKGDAPTALAWYLDHNPETIISLAYFDMDLYQPTYDCLQLIQDRLTIGSVLGFDEVNDHLCPGETQAVREVLGLNRHSIQRFPHNSRSSYLVFGG